MGPEMGSVGVYTSPTRGRGRPREDANVGSVAKHANADRFNGKKRKEKKKESN